MIASLTGTVASIGLDSLVLDVHGVGYLVRTTPSALAHTRHGAELTLHTELVVREDSMTLFGFPSSEDAETFRIVQSVSGIGPRLALSVLAVLSPEDLRRAVAAQDVKVITRTPGIGPKVASRMILELGGKLAAPTSEEPGAEPAGDTDAGGPEDPLDAQVITALSGLGWPDKAAADAVAGVHQEADAPEDAAGLLRAALRRLGGSR
ncbi:Holliday junction branch migration protein RuvA [Brachybacterium endophyticum]|uniref:Holliday junction branch migration complex subunit RuvA n=1 Tax=Brachybacterium endophyticum TaxID=2182385 RepID=A0A2U2RJ36_9MICO|nr:Holliday junction branch migration protein RuvA [Brachybacterium endophyticum]PWH05889.1 Holliday junction branch migration protein RuvA [Brachybacterium endophyticum]